LAWVFALDWLAHMDLTLANIGKSITYSARSGWGDSLDKLNFPLDYLLYLWKN
jgi:hypothetical protein